MIAAKRWLLLKSKFYDLDYINTLLENTPDPPADLPPPDPNDPDDPRNVDFSSLTIDDLIYILELVLPLEIEPTTFREDKINFVECSDINCIVDATNYEKEKDNKEYSKFRIEWKENLYTVEQFFKEAYTDYKIFPYKIRPKKGNQKLFYLSKGQRKKIQYSALQYHYEKYHGGKLVIVSEEDNRNIKSLCGRYFECVDTASELLSRLYYDNGLSKIITFGASITVDGNNKDNYCYKIKEKTEKSITCLGISMTWEKWTEAIKEKLDFARQYKTDSEEFKELYEQAEKMIYYQREMNLTLTGEFNEIMRNCLYQYSISGKADFPEGQIPNAELTFTIDFDDDIEIYKSHENKHNKDIKGKNEAYKKFNTLNAAIGDIVTRQQLLALKWNDKNIARYIDYKFMERVTGKRGAYRILIK